MNANYTEGKIVEKQDYTLNSLPKGDYENCTFLYCDFSSGNLSGVNFINCNFKHCNLSLAKTKK